MKIRIKNTSLTLKIISWEQIIGGITGLGLMAYLMMRTDTINGPLLLILLFGLALFSYSIYSGKRLFADEDKTTGIVISIINQILQIFQWNILGYGLTYSSGAALTLGIEQSAFKFNFGAIVSSFNMSINTDDEVFLKVNLVAILVIVVLADILREMKENNLQVVEDAEPIAD